MADILVVDDDQSIITAFRRFLSDEGHQVVTAGSGVDALERIRERRPDLVFMDVRMPGMSGIETLEAIRREFPDLAVVIMTAYGTSQTSIDAIRAGAFDYLAKPLDLDDLRAVMSKALSAVQPTGAEAPEPEWSDDERPVQLVGNSPGMLQVYKLIGRLATNDVPALIIGERGTGKQLIAETIHNNSGRRNQPFAAIDCATLGDSGLDEMFDPQSGTVLLANVERVPGPLQARLVRALGELQARAAVSGPRLGARILASTEADLADAVRQAAFNLELYDVLSVITIRVPPLRERREDIPQLVRHLLHRLNAELNRNIRAIDGDVARMLHEHPWPGNVRELESVLKRACVLARADVVTQGDLGGTLKSAATEPEVEGSSSLRAAVVGALHERLDQRQQGGSPFHDVVDFIETTLVQEALAITRGNQVKASELLGVNRATLRKKMADTS